jgi:hypothetical protein
MRERGIPWQWTTSIRIEPEADQTNIGRACGYFRVGRRNFSRCLPRKLPN